MELIEVKSKNTSTGLNNEVTGEGSLLTKVKLETQRGSVEGRLGGEKCCLAV